VPGIEPASIHAAAPVAPSGVDREVSTAQRRVVARQAMHEPAHPAGKKTGVTTV